MHRLGPHSSVRPHPCAARTAATTATLLALALLLPASSGAAVSQTFSSPSNTGATGTYVVPAGITSLHVEAVGGKGGGRPAGPVVSPSRAGGFGAVVSGDIPVVPGQTLYVYVAGNGAEGNESFEETAGGANGGGGSEGFGSGAGGGGGASDVRTIVAPSSAPQTTSLESRLLVAAGGGGGASAENEGVPGDGNGGDAGQPGPSSFCGAAAQPGTANADGTGVGGAGGTCGVHGEAGTLGDGGLGAADGAYAGGGGGGGLYGGGGGASGYGQPGAGGASWVEQSASNPSTSKIDTTGDPRVTISYEPPTPAPTTPTSTPTTTTVAHVPPPAPVAPLLEALHGAHRCVTSAALGQPQAGDHGLAFSFTLSESANVTFTIMHRVGSPAWSRCPRSHGHKAGRYRTIEELTQLAPAGTQTTSLGTTARVRRDYAVTALGPGRHRVDLAGIAKRRLRPGTYVLFARAVNSSGQSSGVSVVKFWVVR